MRRRLLRLDSKGKSKNTEGTGPLRVDLKAGVGKNKSALRTRDHPITVCTEPPPAGAVNRRVALSSLDSPDDWLYAHFVHKRLINRR
jgi:hypothetical protein